MHSKQHIAKFMSDFFLLTTFLYLNFIKIYTNYCCFKTIIRNMFKILLKYITYIVFILNVYEFYIMIDLN